MCVSERYDGENSESYEEKVKEIWIGKALPIYILGADLPDREGSDG